MDEDIRHLLLRDGLIQGDDAEILPLTGGVSSEIYRVRDGKHMFAVKRALRKLKVADDWFVDLSRNASEVEYLRTVGQIAPGAVPAVEFASAKDGYFAMEFLGDGFANWKELLLEGKCDPAHAVTAARTLATIHGATWDDSEVRARFETTENFHALRLDPYLLTTGKRHPDLEPLFVAEVERIASTRHCLVHGDYSPKNLLLAPDRFVILDCEVAWFGDPTFDVAFLLNHFFLKAAHRLELRQDYLKLASLFLTTYLKNLPETGRKEVDPENIQRLLAMLMLARIDGKSPVEYLREDEGKKTLVREFARQRIANPAGDIFGAWLKTLDTYAQN